MKHCGRGAAIVAGLLVAARAVSAQERDSTRADSVPVVLTSIDVTTSRGGGGQFALPIAITQVPKLEMFGANGYGLDRALQLVPGVIAQSRYGTSDVRITIRGFGARGAGDRSNAGTSRGIRVLLDGFPETEPDGRTSFDDIDLATASEVEVVRSNASAEWGNAAGGVVSVSTVPDFQRHLFALEPAAGSYGLRRYTARAGTRLGTGRLATSVVRTEFGGWRTHSAADRTLVNISVTAPLDTGTELGVFAVGSVNRFRIPGPLTAAQVDGDPRQANATYLARDERRVNRVARVGTSLTHQITRGLEMSGMLFVNPKFLQRSERGTFRDFTRYHVGGNTVFRGRGLLSGSVSGAFAAGTDAAYQDGAILFYSLTPQGTRGSTLQNNQREGARNVGVFVQGELGFSDRLTVSVGARYDDITYHNEDFLNPQLNAQKSFTGVSPKIGLTYRFSPTHNVYASVGGGVEAPAGNETDPASTFGQDTIVGLNPLLDPIHSTTYEAGTKHVRWLGGTGPLRGVGYDVAVFQTDVENEIVPYRGGRFYFTAGTVRRRGVELGATVQGAGGLSVRAALTLSDFRYRSYVVDSAHYGQPGRIADYSGNRVVGAPTTNYTLTAVAAPRSVPFSARVTLQGTSSYFADDANQVNVPKYHTIAATVGANEPIPMGRAIGIAGFVTVENILDRAFIGSAFLNPDVVAGAPVAFEPGMPRHVLVGFTLSRLDR